MADISGFRGVMYDPSRVSMSDVLAPPYDVVGEEERTVLAERDPANCIRVILPAADADADAKYVHAKELMTAWTEEGILVRDQRPALYLYHQVFSHAALGNQTITRRGFIAAVRLHDFNERVIRRHERTLRGPKIDRLKLWETTSCHLSQIFTLYSDPKGKVDACFSNTDLSNPTIDGTTADGTRHLLWRVDDPLVISAVRGMMAEKNLYIADGHHRYETMLAFRNRLLEKAPEASDRSAARFGMMFLANVDDPGLVVLPTHRLIHGVANFDADVLRKRLKEFFEINVVESAATDAGLLGTKLSKANREGTSFALIIPGDTHASVLTLKKSIDLAAAGVTGSDEVLTLDVTLLHGLVLENILGIDRVQQEAQTCIQYIKDTQSALELCQSGHGQACFMMNATPLRQVIAVSDADEVMPQKSTFFYPKIASGMVFNSVDVNETL